MTAKELAEVRVALAFYADPKHWLSSSTGFAAQYDPEPSPVARDRGAYARRTLATLFPHEPAPQASRASLRFSCYRCYDRGLPVCECEPSPSLLSTPGDRP